MNGPQGTLLRKKEGHFKAYILLFLLLNLESITWVWLSKLKASHATTTQVTNFNEYLYYFYFDTFDIFKNVKVEVPNIKSNTQIESTLKVKYACMLLTTTRKS